MSGEIEQRVWKSRVAGLLQPGSTIGLQGLSSLANLVITWFLVRALGLEGFGVFSIIFVIANAVMAVAVAFVVNPLNSLASALGPRGQREFFAAARLGMLLAVTLIAGLTAFAALVASNFSISARAVWAAGLLTGAISIGEYYRRVLFLQGRTGNAGFYDATRYIALAALFAVAFAQVPHADPLIYVTALGASYPIALIPLLAVARSESPVSPKRRLARLRQLSREGRWQAKIAMLSFLDGNGLLLATFAMLGPYAAGMIRLAQSIVGIANPVLYSLEHTVPRWLGSLQRKLAPDALWQAYMRLALRIIAAFAVLYALIVVTTPFVLEIVNVEAGTLVIALVGAFCVYSLSCAILVLIEIHLRFTSRSATLTRIRLAACAATFAMLIPAVTALGPIGAILVMVFAKLVSIAACLAGIAAGDRPLARESLR